MGTLARQATAKDLDTALITSDLDLLQMIDPNVHVYALKKGFSNIDLFHPESFKEKYGVEVAQFLDLKSIKGDSSDNIPGVPGIGEKGAVELLKQYETLDGIYENIELIKDSLKKKLVAGKDSAYLSKKLAAIWTDAPIKLDLKAVDGSKSDPIKVQVLLEKFEFKSMARNLPEYMHIEGETDLHKPAKLTVAAALYIKTAEELEKLTLPQNKNLADELFIHAISAKSHGQEPLSLTISPDAKTTITFDLASLKPESVGKKLKSYIEDLPLVGYNLKSIMQILFTLGIDAKHVEHDVLVGAFLINSLIREQSLSELAGADLHIHIEENSDGTDGIGSEADIIAVVRGLYDLQKKQLAKMPKVQKLANEIEWPLTNVLAHMEYQGIKLDTKYLKVLSVEIEDKISDLTQEIYGHADMEFNIASPAQLAEVLFDKLKLPTAGVKKGKTGYSTAAAELDKLRGQHEIIDLISQYREVTKLKNTYVDTLPEQVDKNSRLHTTFALTVAQTGRLSSNEPNLQNIPVRTDLGKRIRTAFEPEPGNVFVSADYSQFELRIAAYLCNDKELIRQFNEDIDVHTATAAEVYGRKTEDVTKNMRREAKVVNFGVMYGLSTHGLVAATGMSYEAAKDFIAKYFEVRPKLKAYIDSVKKQADEQGYVENIFGRRRPTPDVKSSNFMVREGAYRAAVNMPFQGSAADIMKQAMVDVQQKLEGTDSKMLLQIHDSVLVECPKKDAEKVAKILKETMEAVIKLPVKLTVDTDTASTWGTL